MKGAIQIKFIIIILNKMFTHLKSPHNLPIRSVISSNHDWTTEIENNRNKYKNRKDRHQIQAATWV